MAHAESSKFDVWIASRSPDQRTAAGLAVVAIVALVGIADRNEYSHGRGPYDIATTTEQPAPETSAPPALPVEQPYLLAL